MPNDNLSYREGLPEGWHSLFDELVAKLQILDREVQIVRAKQKFGELRVYLKRYPAGAHDIVDAATAASKSICETCGRQAILRVTNGHYQTLCEVHGAKALPARKDPIVARLRLDNEGLSEVDVEPSSDRTIDL
ncbi:MAG: hypothetical protein J7493_00160 [Porphyrobacter sp.]|nr:hypothetical protein [Porphyrobacter sp.]